MPMSQIRRERQLDIRIEARQVMTSDQRSFYIDAKLEAFEDDLPVFSKQWQQSFDRDGV